MDESAAQALMREKASAMEAILEAAKQQLAIAQGEYDQDAMDAAFLSRDERMAQVDRINAELGQGGPERDEGIRALLMQIDALDQQTRAALTQGLSVSGTQMRDAQKIKQGVSAYMGTQEQVGSFYIDQKK